MKIDARIVSVFLVLLLAGVLLIPGLLPTFRLPQIAAIAAVSPFVYSFNSPGTLNESGVMFLSTSPYWWLNSGGQLLIQDSVGSTMVGEAPLTNAWRLLYALANSVDTDGGTHPQNIFRLVSRSTWENVSVQAHFKILKDNWSVSPNRNASNGLLVMSRYLDGDTLYYTGIRVDGAAVIKKKYRGTYYTMAEKKEFAGEYVEGGHVSMLPHQTWFGLKSETITNADGSVTVTLFMQKDGGSWKKLLEARDSGGYGGTPPITKEGFIGIRTDFMDVQFSNFRAQILDI